jgi:hypothetical protein
MAAHSLETLLRLWGLDNLTTEQAIGQILQILVELEPRVKRVEQTMAIVQASLPKPAPPPNPAPPAAPPTPRTRRRAQRTP